MNSNVGINSTKSKSDNREYLYKQLSNGLKVVIISDPETDKSACAMNVTIGSLCDPLEFQGMAHFLEHMLFMGTEKYPDENQFGEFINENSGTTNAFTEFDNTNYHYDISNEAFDKALDIFAQFFISPLFKENSVQREMKAVDSEFKKNLRDDEWKFIELIYSESTKNSPFKKFSSGNLQTLNKHNIRNNLIHFHKSYYSSHLMNLTILNKKSIKELEVIVDDIFSLIPCFEVKIPDFSNPFPFSEKNLGNLYYTVPVREEECLRFYWILDYAGSHYKTEPLYYITALLGHEGPNSLFSSLIDDGLATSLVTDYSHIAKTFSRVNMDITLTNKGFSNWEEICKRVIYFLKKIQNKSVNKQFFDELQQISQINFDFSEKEIPYDYCCDIAGSMQKYEPEDIITGSELMKVYNEEIIMKYLDDMRIDNLNVYVTSKKLNKFCKMKEKWFKTHFTKKKFSEEIYDFYEECDITKNICEHNLDYPPKNNFVPTNLNIHPSPTINEPFPTVIHKEEGSLIWYKQDTTFNLPKVIINLQIYLNKDILTHRKIIIKNR